MLLLSELPGLWSLCAPLRTRKATVMSTDPQRLPSSRPSAPEPGIGDEAQTSPKYLSRLRHRVETYRCDGFKCVYCGKDLLADSDALLLATVDHVIPLAAGGGDGWANRATCCCACNRLKGCTAVRSIEVGRQVIAQRREEELARYREALGDLAPPRSSELVALAAGGSAAGTHGPSRARRGN